MRRFAVFLSALLTVGCSGADNSFSVQVATTIIISPTVDTIRQLGATRQFSATVLDVAGKTILGAPVFWSVADQSIAQINSSGALTAKGHGSTDVTAQSGAATAHVREVVDLGPPIVKVVSATQLPIFGGARLHVVFRNEGGPGVFKMQAWGLPTSPNGANSFDGETEAVTIPATWSDSATYNVTTVHGNPIDWLLIFSRPASSLTYQQTDRFDFR